MGHGFRQVRERRQLLEVRASSVAQAGLELSRVGGPDDVYTRVWDAVVNPVQFEAAEHRRGV